VSKTILLIEDNPDVARLHTRGLAAAEQYHVLTAPSAAGGVTALSTATVDCVLLDYRLPDADGLTVLRLIRQRYPEIPVILVTGAGNEEVAVEAMKLGAADYIVKHGQYLDRLSGVVRGALGHHHLNGAHSSRAKQTTAETRLPRDVRERYRAYGIVGESAELEQALVLAERAAQSKVHVLLEGETGTGKELFARAIHQQGPRATKPFIAVDCGALPEGILESELFGHVRGSFTGATQGRQGLLEAARGGTLFLDELGNTAPVLQAKLLRALEEGAVRPLGSDREHPVDVRIIGATNRDLMQDVLSGTFRRDLYYRLAAFRIRLPSLRERREDILELARYYLELLSGQERKLVRGFEPAALQLLYRYSWPGNIRELRNEIHRLVLCCDGATKISPSMLPNWLRDPGPSRDGDGDRSLKGVVRNVEYAVIEDRLREQGYNRTAAAKSLGISREALWAKMKRLRISVGKLRP
jgi:two-component system NtrC family response regulator